MDKPKKYFVNDVELTIDNIHEYTKMDYWDDIDLEMAERSYSLVLGRHCEVSMNIIREHLRKQISEEERIKLTELYIRPDGKCFEEEESLIIPATM